MGTERIIVEELATVSMTLTELLAITRNIRNEIKDPAFTELFSHMVDTLAQSYDVVISNFNTFYKIEDEEGFSREFDALYAAYAEAYLKEISKPRTYAERAYEDHLELKRMKQSKTSFPLLKRTFLRLDELIDKWADNDVWLAMSIDNMFKRLNHLLKEIADIKQKDVSDAYVIYNSAMIDFKSYIDLISDKRSLL